MKKLFILAGIVSVLLLSCSKNSETTKGGVILAGIKASKSLEIECVNLDSGEVINNTPISSYVAGSTVYDPQTDSYGYLGSDTIFRLIDPETGTEKKSIKLPGLISQAAIDADDFTLIGQYVVVSYADDPDSAKHKIATAGVPVYTNYVIKVDLATGDILANNVVDFGEGTILCGYYYDQETNRYVILRSDNKLLTINPSTGEVTKSVDLIRPVMNFFYNTADKTVIGMNASANPDQINLVVFDPETGLEKSSKVLTELTTFIICIAGYDAASGCYMLVNDKYEVLFIDVTTGKIKKSYQLVDPMSDIKFWRRIVKV